MQFVQVAADTWVANIIGQRDTRKDAAGNPPIRYDAVAAGLGKVGQFAQERAAAVHMPRIGCGLAGGTWEGIEPLIQAQLSAKCIPESCVYCPAGGKLAGALPEIHQNHQ